jgi:hypothetical protein
MDNFFTNLSHVSAIVIIFLLYILELKVFKNKTITLGDWLIVKPIRRLMDWLDEQKRRKELKKEKEYKKTNIRSKFGKAYANFVVKHGGNFTSKSLKKFIAHSSRNKRLYLNLILDQIQEQMQEQMVLESNESMHESMQKKFERRRYNEAALELLNRIISYSHKAKHLAK